MTTTTLTTQLALDAISYERAPRHEDSVVNRRVACADGFKISVQASGRHYANDSSGEAPYWSGKEPSYPFTTFEIGGTSAELSKLDEYESGGIWAWVPREDVAAMLDEHGGVVAWEVLA